MDSELNYSRHYTNTLIMYNHNELSSDSHSLHEQIKSGRHDLGPILADSLEENNEHGNQETLDHLRSGKPVYTAVEDGKFYAYPKDKLKDDLIKQSMKNWNPYENDDEDGIPVLGMHRMLNALNGTNIQEHTLSLVDHLHNIYANPKSSENKSKIARNLADKLWVNDDLSGDIEFQEPDDFQNWKHHPNEVLHHLVHIVNRRSNSHPEYRHIDSNDVIKLIRDNWNDNDNQNADILGWEHLLDDHVNELYKKHNHQTFRPNLG